jgi:hypothetical protein
MNLPLMLAGPLLRRVEANLVSVWIALKEAGSVKLSLWVGGEIKAGEKEPTVSGPDPAAQTLRVGPQLHVVVVTLKLSLGNALLPDRTYSYDYLSRPLPERTRSSRWICCRMIR